MAMTVQRQPAAKGKVSTASQNKDPTHSVATLSLDTATLDFSSQKFSPSTISGWVLFIQGIQFLFRVQIAH